MKSLKWKPLERRALVPAGLLSFLFAFSPAVPASAVTITIHNADGFQEGFNDPSPRAPVGGNPATTLGGQRLFVFQHAAQVWGMRLGGELPVVMRANFDPLGGTSVSATLGFAAPTTVHREFLNAPKPLTWYVAGLTNQYYGTDLNDLVPQSCPVPLASTKCPDMRAEFNSDVDNQTVLGAVDFYYGIDGNSGSDINFLAVVLHEMAHGLGLIDLIDPDTGIIDPNPQNPSCQSCSDAYSENLENSGFSPKNVGDMTKSQRLQAIVDDGDLVWAGAAVKAVSSRLSEGVANDDAVLVYAPTTYRFGSSVSHLDVSVAPNELMEPFASNPSPRDLTVTLALLEDLGWETLHVPACGDANDDGKLTTTDSLLILKTAVGDGECEDYVCDVNLAGGITSADALLLLKSAVGQDVSLKCPLA